MLDVIVVDDEREFATDLMELLKSEGFEVTTFSTLVAAKEAMMHIEEPFILFLDHDFGESTGHGYELCAWLRSIHPYGLILPVVYLTGREQPTPFLDRQREDPHLHPSCFVGKADLARDPGLISKLARSYDTQFSKAREIGEDQSARQAMICLHTIEINNED